MSGPHPSEVSRNPEAPTPTRWGGEPAGYTISFCPLCLESDSSMRAALLEPRTTRVLLSPRTRLLPIDPRINWYEVCALSQQNPYDLGSSSAVRMLESNYWAQKTKANCVAGQLISPAGGGKTLRVATMRGGAMTLCVVCSSNPESWTLHE